MTAPSADASAAPLVEISRQPVVDVPGTTVLAVPVRPGPGDDGGGVRLGPGCDSVGQAYEVDLAAVAVGRQMTGRAGETVLHPLVRLVRAGLGPAREVLLVGVGAGTPADLRRAGAGVARAARGRGAVATTVAVASEVAVEAGASSGSGQDPPVSAATVQAFVEGLLLASFTLTWRTGGPERPPVPRVVLCAANGAPADLDEAVRVGTVRGRAGWQAREVASWPSREKTPSWIADRAVALAGETGLTVRVWDERELAADGFDGIVGVGKGSVRPPRLVQLTYRPRGRAFRRHVVLVGKGITFDTGGLSLKRGDGMVTMKRDVTGGAVVLAVMGALRALDVRVGVTGLVAAAENAIGPGAQRPGDVVRHPGGRTSEVANTDAEGRLVLADGLAFAARVLDPDVLVDVATLTGAVRVALGRSFGGLYADDDALADALLAAGRDAGEPLWRLPLVDEYLPDIASDVADARNSGGVVGMGNPSSITAALFLRPFAAGVPWAHLDLSGVGDSTKDTDVWTEGPTGFGARVLLTWLSRPDPLSGVRSAARRPGR
jgi:leucyl aminopeptidase